MAKQTAGWRYFHLAKPDQFRYYLAPGFFSDGNVKKCSSARVIIKSRASVSNREKARGLLQLLNTLLESRVFIMVILFASIAHIRRGLDTEPKIPLLPLIHTSPAIYLTKVIPLIPCCFAKLVLLMPD